MASQGVFVARTGSVDADGRSTADFERRIGAAAKEDAGGGKQGEDESNYESSLVTRRNTVEAAPALCAQAVQFAAVGFWQYTTGLLCASPASGSACSAQ